MSKVKDYPQPAIMCAKCKLMVYSTTGGLCAACNLKIELDKEKARRVYYQDIVYKVCNLLDRHAGRLTTGQGLVCGTSDSPRTDVQDELCRVLATVGNREQDMGNIIHMLLGVMSYASEWVHKSEGAMDYQKAHYESVSKRVNTYLCSGLRKTEGI